MRAKHLVLSWRIRSGPCPRLQVREVLCKSTRFRTLRISMMIILPAICSLLLLLLLLTTNTILTFISIVSTTTPTRSPSVQGPKSSEFQAPRSVLTMVVLLVLSREYGDIYI